MIKVFRLKVDMENDSMSDRHDLAPLLRSIALRLPGTNATEGIVHDVNGNRIGHWVIEESSDD